MCSSMIGPFEHLQGVENRQRSEGEGGRVDDDAGRVVDRLMDPADDLGFAVRLPEFDRAGAASRQ